MSRRLRTERAWRARLAHVEAEHAAYRAEMERRRRKDEALVSLYRQGASALDGQVKAQRADAIRQEVRLGALLLAQQIQTARWHERALTMQKVEEAEFAERCRLAHQLRAMGMPSVVTEPGGIR